MGTQNKTSLTWEHKACESETCYILT